MQQNRTYTIRSLSQVESFPSDPHYISFLKQVAYYYQIDMVHLIGRINHFLKQKQESELALFAEKDDGNYQLHILTTEQQHIVDTITPTITHPCYSPSLIHGVTGSGKTEVYKHLIVHAHQQRKSTILMLPEVTLALRFEHMLRTAFLL